jgi:hypothetical protein
MVTKSNAMNKTAACAFLWLCLADSCFGKQQDALCPRHIEVPTYPAIGRTAHLIGKVVLTLSIDADGKVSDVKVANEDDKSAGPLRLAAIENIRLWTFAKPPVAPHAQAIVYDFKLDDSFPGDDGDHPIVKITFDLPDRVTISANARLVDHNGSEGTTTIKKKHWCQ